MMLSDLFGNCMDRELIESLVIDKTENDRLRGEYPVHPDESPSEIA